MATVDFGILPISGSIGAEIRGIDLRDDLPQRIMDEIDRALVERLMIFFRGQSLAPADQERITHLFGPYGETPFLSGIEGFPDIVAVVKEADESSPATFGNGWHSDFSFQKAPPKATILYARDVPDYGGDTVWADMQSAYDALSPGLRRMLEHMSAVHSAVRSYGPNAKLREHMENMTISNSPEAERTMEHPVVRTHPVTGRKALFVNPVYTLRFKDMTAEESRPLLDFLYAHATRPRFTCRLRWEKGTIAIWDNRATMHQALNDYPGRRREMHRTTVAGERPS